MTRRFRRSVVRLVSMALIATGLVVPVGAALPTSAGAGPAPAAPTITSFTPTKGVYTGGTSVVITGTNLTGATAVTFGDTPATSFTVDSATQITAVTPKRAVGAAEVKVTRGSTVTAATTFIFQPAFTLLHDFFDIANPLAPVPFLLAEGPDGNIWMTRFSIDNNPSKIVSKLLPDGTAVDYTAPAPITDIQSITAGSDGNLWATARAGTGYFNRLLRITPDGTFTVFTDPSMCDAQYIATGGDGNLWMVNRTPCGTGDYNAVRVTPDGTFTTFRVAARNSTFDVYFITAIAGNRIFITSGSKAYVLDTQGNVSSFAPCTKNPSSPLEPLNALIGPDGNLWVTCYDNSNGFMSPGTGYLARVTLDPIDIADSVISYYGSAEVPGMGTPFFMTTGSDGNIWIAQLTGTPPGGSPLPFDPSAPMLRISFPGSYSTPVIEAFDSDVFFMLYLMASSDGYMYADQFTLFAFFLQYYYGSLSQAIAACYQTNSPICESIGIQNFSSLAGIFRIDVGAPAAPTVDAPTAGVDSIDLTWTAPTFTGAGPIVSYRVKYSTHADMSDATVIDTGDTSLSRTLSTLPKGKYYVRIATTNTIVTGPYSPVQSVRVITAPTKFPAVTATAGDGKVTLAYTGTGWDAGDGEGTGVGNACFCNGLGYEYSIDGGTNWQAASGVGTSGMTITGLSNYQTYSIKVRAVNSVGNGPASDAVSVTPVDDGPALCSASGVNRKKVSLCWLEIRPSKGAIDLYRVRLFQTGTTTTVGTCKGGNADRSCTISRPGSLGAATTYDYRVRARVIIGSGSAKQVFWTSWSAAGQVTTTN